MKKWVRLVTGDLVISVNALGLSPGERAVESLKLCARDDLIHLLGSTFFRGRKDQ